MVNLLIELGAGTVANVSRIMDYYRKQSDSRVLKRTLQKLGSRVSLLRWLLRLEDILPGYAPSLPSPLPQLVKSTSLENRMLSLDLSQKIMEEKKQWDSLFSRRTFKVSDSIDFHFHPEFPGIEISVNLLIRGLIDSGTPFCELMKIDGTPCLVSQAIKQGPTTSTISEQGQEQAVSLEWVMKNDPKRLKLLDQEQVSNFILATILLAPEEGTPENYLLIPLKKNSNKLSGVPSGTTYQLISIGEANRKVLSPTIAKEEDGKCRPQVRSILFCLDQMLSTVHSTALKVFTKAYPSQVISYWLTKLINMQHDYAEFFSSSEIKNLKEIQHRTEGLEGTYIGFPFIPKSISLLYQRWTRLRDFLLLRSNSSGTTPPTHLQVLAAVEPQLAQGYGNQLVRVGKPSLKKRWRLVNEDFFLSSTPPVISPRHFVNSLGLYPSLIPPKKSLYSLLKQKQEIGPCTALEELKSTVSEFGVFSGDPGPEATTFLEYRTNDLAEHAQSMQILNAFRSSHMGESARSELLRSLPLSCYSGHLSWLSLVLQLGWTKLHLSPFAGLVSNDDLLKKPDLSRVTWLDISGCKQFTEDIFVKLSVDCPRLQHLDVSSTNFSHFSMVAGGVTSKTHTEDSHSELTFPSLITLRINDCSSIEKVSFSSPELLKLEIRNAIKLINFKGVNPNLQCLDLRGCVRLDDKALDEGIVTCKDLVWIRLQGCSSISHRWFRHQFPGFNMNIYSSIHSDILKMALAWKKGDQTITKARFLPQHIQNEQVLKFLARTLSTNNSLRELIFISPKLDDQGLNYLTKSLVSNTSLQVSLSQKKFSLSLSFSFSLCFLSLSLHDIIFLLRSELIILFIGFRYLLSGTAQVKGTSLIFLQSPRKCSQKIERSVQSEPVFFPSFWLPQIHV
jgi:hypothetical protein